jgi:asparagine synthase (glutamine-hydrolysing)
MCGIAGILNLETQTPLPEDLLTRMISIIRHRGPDETGVYVDDRVGLGHARLSIIGLEGGGQPMSNEDGSLWITYNGEIFNYIELKEALIKKGHVFSTRTDGEVIVHLYEELGPKCLEKMNGQFALAVWDSRKKELFLARDRVGITPLFYTRAQGRFIFASEIKAIFMDPGVAREIDPESLYQVFTFWTTLSPRTVFKGVYELPPGHFMKVRDGEITQSPFWSLPVYAPEDRWKGSFEEAREELKALLMDATRLRLRADVPVGAYLSGGLDSSLITAIIARHFNNRLRTFSMTFQERTFDESPYQEEMQQALGTDHCRTLVTNDLIRENFPSVIWHSEIPLLRTAPVPLFLLSGLVRENQFKVVLTGEGSDEIFGGYNIYREAKVRHFWAQRPDSKIRPLLIQRLYPYIFKGESRGSAFLQKFFSIKPEDEEDPFFSHRVRWNNSARNVTFFSGDLTAGLNDYNPLPALAERLPSGFGTWDMLSKAQYLEMGIFLSGYLLSSQGDRPAMAHSLEIRLPFLDHRIIDFAFRLPARWKIQGLKEKHILKQASEGLVTEGVKKRPKQPYRAPIKEAFFGGEEGGYVAHFLSEESVKRGGYFNPKKVSLLVEKHKRSDARVSSEFQNMALVGILSTQILHDRFIENFPGRAIAPLVPDKVIKIRQRLHD